MDVANAEQTDKWEVQLRKGCLDLAILATLWPEKLYGLEILRRLENHANLALSASTVYPLLARLKADRLVKSEWVETDLIHPRKYYRLTAAGRRPRKWRGCGRGSRPAWVACWLHL